MYSTHNFYFKPNITSIALLPVFDRKGKEVKGLSKSKHRHDTVQLTHRTTCRILRTPDRHCQENCLPFSGTRVCASVWTIVDPPFSLLHPRA
jgi:hypothetical protein